MESGGGGLAMEKTKLISIDPDVPERDGADVEEGEEALRDSAFAVFDDVDGHSAASTVKLGRLLVRFLVVLVVSFTSGAYWGGVFASDKEVLVSTSYDSFGYNPISPVETSYEYDHVPGDIVMSEESRSSDDVFEPATDSPAPLDVITPTGSPAFSDSALKSSFSDEDKVSESSVEYLPEDISSPPSNLPSSLATSVAFSKGETKGKNKNRYSFARPKRPPTINAPADTRPTFSDPEQTKLHYVGPPFMLYYENYEYTINPNADKFTERDDPREWNFKFSKEPYVVNLGLGKTGTLSLWQALIKLGLKANSVSHYVCYPKKKAMAKSKHGNPKQDSSRVVFKGESSECTSEASNKCAGQIFNAVARGLKPLALSTGKFFTQVDCSDNDKFLYPQMTLLDKILESYRPDEIAFVMTTREDDLWIRSTHEVHNMVRQFVKFFPKGGIFESFEFPNNHTGKIPNTSSPESDALMKAFKRWHEERMRALTKGYFFQELDISDPEGLKMNYTNFVQKVFNKSIPEGGFLYPVSHVHFDINGKRVGQHGEIKPRSNTAGARTQAIEKLKYSNASQEQQWKLLHGRG